MSVSEIKFDKSTYGQEFNCLALKTPAKSCGVLIKTLRQLGFLICKPRLASVVNEKDDPTCKRLLLNEKLTKSDVSNWPQDVRKILDEQGACVVDHSIRLDYSYFTAEEVLRSVLPGSVTVPTGHEVVGRVLHLNLNPPQLPFKHVIGQILLDKHQPRIDSVVNKVGAIESEFRVFPLEVLAGSDDLRTSVKEHGCVFHLDVRTVYWNSRLSTEHTRLVEDFFKPGQVVFDMFCGVGPFAIPAAKQGVRVLANDLNPESYKYLLQNVQANKIAAGLVHAFNMDARAVVRHLRQQALRYHAPTSAASEADKKCWPLQWDHVVMNLPATAIEFLDVFRGLYHHAVSDSWTRPPRLPLIHCYGFTRHAQPKEDFQQRVSLVLGVSDPASITFECLHMVRNVAPNKDMYCLTFRLPAEVAFADPRTATPATPAPVSGAESGAEATAAAIQTEPSSGGVKRSSAELASIDVPAADDESQPAKRSRAQ